MTEAVAVLQEELSHCRNSINTLSAEITTQPAKISLGHVSVQTQYQTLPETLTSKPGSPESAALPPNKKPPIHPNQPVHNRPPPQVFCWRCKGNHAPVLCPQWIFNQVNRPSSHRPPQPQTAKPFQTQEGHATLGSLSHSGYPEAKTSPPKLALYSAIPPSMDSPPPCLDPQVQPATDADVLQFQQDTHKNLHIPNADIWKAQQEDSAIKDLYRKIMETGEVIENPTTKFTILEDKVYRVVQLPHKTHYQIYLPTTLRQQFLHHYHIEPLSGHLGRYKTFKRLQALVYWPKMSLDVREYVRCCQVCQRQKSETRKPPAKLHQHAIHAPPEMLGVAQFQKLVKGNLEKARKRQKQNYDKGRRDGNFTDNDRVWLHTHPYSKAEQLFSEKLAPRWKGPYRVTRRFEPLNLEVILEDTGQDLHVVNVAQLEPCYPPRQNW
uniref:Gypsy retrotransposon integrase-like protein 1 n=1 Tax=Sphaeramia orbicularis TaxID=375764 RepID=A0A672YY78_9TELE